MNDKQHSCLTPEQLELAVRIEVSQEAMLLMVIRSRSLIRQLLNLSSSQQLLNRTFVNAGVEIKDTVIRSVPASVVAGLMGAVGTLVGGPQIGFIAAAAGGSIGAELVKPLTSRTGTHTQLYPTCSGNTVEDIYQEALRHVKDRIKSFAKWKEFCREYVNPSYTADFCIDTAIANAPDAATSIMKAGMDLTQGSFSPLLQLTADPLFNVLGSAVSHTFVAGLDPRGIYNKGKDTVRAWANFHPGQDGGGQLSVKKLTKLLENYKQYMSFLEGINIVSGKLVNSLETSINAERLFTQRLPNAYFMNTRTDISSWYKTAKEAIDQAVKALQRAIYIEEQRKINKKNYQMSFAQYDAS